MDTAEDKLNLEVKSWSNTSHVPQAILLILMGKAISDSVYRLKNNGLLNIYLSIYLSIFFLAAVFFFILILWYEISDTGSVVKFDVSEICSIDILAWGKRTKGERKMKKKFHFLEINFIKPFAMRKLGRL